jgi:hypothetical protein
MLQGESHDTSSKANRCDESRSRGRLADGDPAGEVYRTTCPTADYG